MLKLKLTSRRLVLAFFLGVLLLLFVLGTFFLKIYRVSQFSMSNTFADGDRVLVSTFRSGGISRNDILIFSHLGGRYIKRCVAVAGDTLQISGWRVSVNSEEPEPAGTMRLTSPDSRTFPGYTSPESKHPFDISVFQEYHQYWNLEDFGPYIVPKRGALVKLDEANIKLYSSAITREIGKMAFQKLTAKSGRTYRFRKDYYFMVGDNRPGSTDSRSFGGIRKDQVIGKVIYRLYKHKK